jgi:dTDP-glucose 4,6-dehydratase
MRNEHPKIKLVGVDKMTYAASESAKSDILVKEGTLYVEDIAGPNMNHVFAKVKPDYVVNFAAESHVDNSIESSAAFVHTNVNGTHNLLHWGLKYGVRRFHQVSTDEVFGSNLGDPTKEDYPYTPRNPYAATKAAADHLVQAYSITHGLNSTISYCGNNFGPTQHQEKMVPTIVRALREGIPVPMYGDGLYEREWIFVRDHARAIKLIVLDPIASVLDGKFNVGPGKRMTNAELVARIATEMKIEEYTIRRVQDRPGHDRRYAIDSTKFNKWFEGWKPFPLEFAMEETVKGILNG